MTTRVPHVDCGDMAQLLVLVTNATSGSVDARAVLMLCRRGCDERILGEAALALGCCFGKPRQQTFVYCLSAGTFISCCCVVMQVCWGWTTSMTTTQCP